MDDMVSTAENMPDSAVVCKRDGNILRRCKMIQMHILAPNNGIIRLKSLGGKENCRSKALNVCREVENKMKFGFIEPARCPASYTIQKFSNCILKMGLKVSISGTQMKPTTLETHNVFIDVCNCWLPEEGD